MLGATNGGEDLGRIRHLGVFRPSGIPANDEFLTSHPAADTAEHLSVLYRNSDGLFVTVVPEGQELGVSEDGRFMFAKTAGNRPLDTKLVAGVPRLQ